MLPVAILAGGLATRLRPITEKIPKALVEVAGEPFICRQLDYLHAQGITEVVLCIGYLGDKVAHVVGDGRQFGLTVRYSLDGAALLGTGGALKQALPILGPAFFMLYGDSFLPINFASVENAWCESGKPALMTVLRNNGRWDKSNVIFRDGELLEYNKHSPKPEMSFIDYGLGVLSASVFDSYEAGRAFDLADVYRALAFAGDLTGKEVHERFYEIGSHAGLAETERYFLRRASI